MKDAEINAEFARFCELPPGADGLTMPTHTCLAFAIRIARLQREETAAILEANPLYAAPDLADLVREP